MTIDEAIKYLEDLRRVEVHKLNSYIPAALSLGIEALKRELKHREIRTGEYIHLLPGETEE